MRILARLAFFTFFCTLVFDAATKINTDGMQCASSVSDAYIASDPETTVRAGCKEAVRNGKVAEVFGDAIYHQLKK